MSKYLRITLLFLISISYFSFLNGQEMLTGLYQNTTLINYLKQETFIEKTDLSYPAVTLPFLDDFSDYTIYPKPTLWMDRQGFVNNTFPLRPPTIGVVTLDALDEYGKVYKHASTTPFPADTLTSRPIRLDSIFSPKRPLQIRDSIYFSFYFQPGGGTYSYPYKEWERIGDRPDNGDKLILEFGYATGDSIFIAMLTTDFLIEEQVYVAGDSIPNPYMPGAFYYFNETAFPGDIIQMPTDSVFGAEMFWKTVWETDGLSLDTWLDNDPLRLNYFKQVMIPITDPQYLRNNFQFRFRNYASIEDRNSPAWRSNRDQWHIDYVYLNINRVINDVYPDDVAFVAPTTSFLKKYQSMPWQQFRQSDMRLAFENQLSNLAHESKNCMYGFQVDKSNGTNIYTYPMNNENAPPYFSDGLVKNPNHANPAINFTLPTNSEDSALFIVTHLFQVEGGRGDFCQANDTMRFEQKFYNYYAYDDGTPEAGHVVLSRLAVPESSLAVRFTLAQPDTLRAIRIWFNGVLDDSGYGGFVLKVWDVDREGKPGEEIYSQAVTAPIDAESHLDFTSYFLEKPLPVSDSFFIGYYQNGNTILNIGFDQNNDSREELYSNTINTWDASFYKGAVMIRPVLGKYIDPYKIRVHEAPENLITLFPNPAQDVLYFKTPEVDVHISRAIIYDMYGKVVLTTSNLSANSINISRLSSGVYFVEFISAANILNRSKFIKL